MNDIKKAFSHILTPAEGSVAELFQRKIGQIEMVTDYIALNDMPHDSNCGRDCAKAIIAGAGLLTHTKAGFGEDFGLSAEVRRITLRICLVYITG
jgi:hypothetical protein